MGKPFARLFGPDDNQILVKLGESDGHPEVRFYFQVDESIASTCELALGYDTPEEAEKVFLGITEKEAQWVFNKQRAFVMKNFGNEPKE